MSNLMSSPISLLLGAVTLTVPLVVSDTLPTSASADSAKIAVAHEPQSVLVAEPHAEVSTRLYNTATMLAAGDQVEKAEAVKKAEEQVGLEGGESGCSKSGECEIGKPSGGCPDVPCREELDACIYLAVPSVRPSDPTFSAVGVFAFDSIFSSAAARGVENATIRAMNATKACPDAKDCNKKKDCDKKDPAEAKTETKTNA